MLICILQAWQQIKRGKPKDVLRLVQDAPVPRLSADEVVVKGTLLATTLPNISSSLCLLRRF